MIFDGFTTKELKLWSTPKGCLWVYDEVMVIGNMIIRCRTCGGHPMEVPMLGVSWECRCRQSNWVQTHDGETLFIWDETKIVKNKLRFWR